MAYVCVSLAAPDSSGIQQCQQWAQQSFLGLPDITIDQAGQICVAMALVLIAAWSYKVLIRLLK